MLKGTKRKDVVLALGGDDRIKTFSDGDIVCAGAGADVVDAGENGESGGFDLVMGGPGNDKITLGRELGTAKGEAGNDLLIGSKGGDNLVGGPGMPNRRPATPTTTVTSFPAARATTSSTAAPGRTRSAAAGQRRRSRQARIAAPGI